MKPYSYLLISALFITSCRNKQERLITGKWQAIKLVECDDPVPIQTDLVNIEFKSNGKYIFNSTLNIKEEGTFEIKKNYLFTHDKLLPNTNAKAVIIKQLSNDTLVLEMNYKGKEQWLTLSRDNTIEPSLTDAKKDESKPAIASVVPPVENPTATPKADTIIKTPPVIRQTEVKKETPKPEPEPEKTTAKTAYQKREAQRKKEEEDRKAEERKRYEAYIKREIKRKKEEIDRLEDLKEKAEAKRLKKEVENLSKKI
jgi:hypothetical protein